MEKDVKHALQKLTRYKGENVTAEADALQKQLKEVINASIVIGKRKIQVIKN